MVRGRAAGSHTRTGFVWCFQQGFCSHRGFAVDRNRFGCVGRRHHARMVVRQTLFGGIHLARRVYLTLVHAFRNDNAIPHDLVIKPPFLGGIPTAVAQCVISPCCDRYHQLFQEHGVHTQPAGRA